MSDVTIYGPKQSSYVRTARLVCEEKGIEYTLQPVKFDSAELGELHPYRKVPILQHGDVMLWETQAIARYLDESFDGADMSPNDPAGRGKMEQWISALNCYIYRDAISNYVLKYIFPTPEGPDRAVIDKAVPKVKAHFGHLDKALGNGTWLAGEQLSLADLFVFPVVAGVSMFPEGKEIMEGCSNLSKALAGISDRPSWAATSPM